ncbi:MAG: hypothetical protein HDT43_01165 [Ruminococcaceae bacterium]|nr:hypothetical protein [Oscillospiraceae bacterium]
MKKLTAIICILALLTAFTGCNNNETSDSFPENTGVSAPESTTENTESTENSESTPESSSVPEQRLSDEELEMISKLEVQSFVGVDGETVMATDAAEVFDAEKPHNEVGSPGFKFDSVTVGDDVLELDEDGNFIEHERLSTVLRYDFAYIRYCRPLFYIGEMLDKDVEQQMIDELPEDKWFKVRAGDKLDCGLTVKKAVYEHFPAETYENTIRDNYIEFDGEVTLEGIMSAVKNDDAYLVKMNDLTFRPDPTKTSGIPDCTRALDTEYVISRGMYNSDGDYYLADGYAAWIIGTVDDIDSGYILGDDDVVRVKVTLKNVKYGGILSVDLPAFYAEITDIERID